LEPTLNFYIEKGEEINKASFSIYLGTFQTLSDINSAASSEFFYWKFVKSASSFSNIGIVDVGITTVWLQMHLKSNITIAYVVFLTLISLFSCLYQWTF